MSLSTAFLLSSSSSTCSTYDRFESQRNCRARVATETKRSASRGARRSRGRAKIGEMHNCGVERGSVTAAPLFLVPIPRLDMQTEGKRPGSLPSNVCSTPNGRTVHTSVAPSLPLSLPPSLLSSLLSNLCFAALPLLSSFSLFRLS